MKSASACGVLLDAEEIAFVLAVAGAAIAGCHGIDEHEIGEVEPARIVGDEAGRGAEQFPLGARLDGFGADGAEVKIGRGRARPAVEDEIDRPLRVLRLAHIGDVKDIGQVLASCVAERKRAGLRAVGDLDAGEMDAVLRGRGGRNGRCIAARGLRRAALLASRRLCGRPGLRRRLCILAPRARGQENKGCERCDREEAEGWGQGLRQQSAPVRFLEERLIGGNVGAGRRGNQGQFGVFAPSVQRDTPA